MWFIPEGILRDIVRRVGKEGFRELVPFIASGKEGKAAAYDKAVLADVDIDEFIFVTSLANEESIYRHFFFKCFEAGNLTAKYVEGLRLAVKTGPSAGSLELMQSAEDCIVYAQFAVGVFSICGGRFDEGIATLASLYRKVNYLIEVVEIAEAVMDQVVQIGPPAAGNYNRTYRFPQNEIPMCVSYCCSMDDVCFDCIAFWYSERIRDIC